RFLVPHSGASTVAVAAGAGGSASVLFSAGLGTRGLGATMNFAPADGQSRILLNAQSNGFIGGWATANGADFAMYDSVGGVIEFAPYGSSFLGSGVIRIDTNRFTESKTIQALKMDCGTGSVTLTIDTGETLTLATGGLLKTGASIGLITGGKL